MHLFVRNSEPADSGESEPPSHGVGLASANARLDLLFGHRHSLAIDHAVAGNVTLHVMMPAQRTAA